MASKLFYRTPRENHSRKQNLQDGVINLLEAVISDKNLFSENMQGNMPKIGVDYSRLLQQTYCEQSQATIDL